MLIETPEMNLVSDVKDVFVKDSTVDIEIPLRCEQADNCNRYEDEMDEQPCER